MVGLDPELSTIQGMFVLNQKETPGLGNYITDGERFRDQFVGKKLDSPLSVVKSDPDPDHGILALTGATISSESVSDIINRTVDNLRQPILDAGDKRVMVHYDGQLALIADQIAVAPYAIIDSLTEPPEGDMTYDECRRRWPSLVFWANINVGLYHRPAEEPCCFITMNRIYMAI